MSEHIMGDQDTWSTVVEVHDQLILVRDALARIVSSLPEGETVQMAHGAQVVTRNCITTLDAAARG